MTNRLTVERSTTELLRNIVLLYQNFSEYEKFFITGGLYCTEGLVRNRGFAGPAPLPLP